MKTLITIAIGVYFGTILILSRAIEWSTIQDMFYFRSFHMYGLLFSAILTSFISLKLIKYFGVKSIKGNQVEPKLKPWQPKANVIGGLFFGTGWALSGACSAPAFILVGFDWKIGLLIVGGMLIGAICYGSLIKKLPH